MNRDRGNIKWTSLMLPEHVQQLKKLAKQYERKTQPVIDPQQYDEWGLLLQDAVVNDKIIKVRILKDGIESEFQGFVYKVDQIYQRLILTNRERSERTTLLFQDMTSICLAD